MKKLNQNGDIVTAVFGTVFILGVAICIYSTTRLVVESNRFNSWSSACMSHGGYLSHPTRISSDREWYDCIVDNKTYVVPGFEAYERERPANLPKQ